MRRVRAAFVIAALVACAKPPHAEVPTTDVAPDITSSTAITYYDVEGRTPEELWSSVIQRAPRNSAGSAVGEIRTGSNAEWRTIGDGVSCSVTSVRIEMHSEITLPRWSAPQTAPTALRAQWTQFLRAVEQHEEGHREISRRFARELQATLLNVRARCSSLNDDMKAIIAAGHAREREEQARYDADRGPATFPAGGLGR